MPNGRNAEHIFGWNADSYCPISGEMPNAFSDGMLTATARFRVECRKKGVKKE